MDENITIEFVRNWIEKHHLTRKSYESVLTDALTNNGHYYIDNPYLRDWIRENTETFRNILPYELNENQQIVLEWLKEQVSNGETLQYILWELTDNAYEEPAMGILSAHTKAWLELEEAEQFQVLAAFAEWGGTKI